MSLKYKLLIPISVTLFLTILVFMVYLILDQTKKRTDDLNQKIENMSQIIAFTNVTSVWNFDNKAMEQNLNSFLKDNDIIRIEIKDTTDNSIIMREEGRDLSRITRKVDIIHDEKKLGYMEIDFTDHFLKQDINAMIQQLIFAEIILLAVLALSLIIIANIISRPIINLVAILKDVSEGEGDLSRQIKIKGHDETGKLSGYLNQFIEKLRKIIINLKNVGSKSTEIGTNLANSSQEVSSTINEISSTMGSMNNGINFLFTEIEKLKNSMQSINAYIDRVLGLIEDQAVSVNESSASVEEMISNVNNIEQSTGNKLNLVNNLVAVAEKGRNSMTNTVNSIEEIFRSTETIFEMNIVINNVASQINLLAMNAAIEAAHAGVYGKGFAVVADEIRKLAEQTTSNAKNISGSLKTITDKIKNTSEITRESNKVIIEIIGGISDIAGSMKETLLGLKEISTGNKQITDSLVILNDLTGEVMNFSREMRKGTAGNEASIQYIYKIADETRNGISEISIGMTEISKTINMLLELSLDNSKNIQILDGEMAKFKT